MRQYLDLLRTIKEKGTKKPSAREGMPGSTSLFGYQFRHDLSEGFPLLTTKKMFWKGVVVELLWFLRGDTNIKYLVDNGVNIWNEDAYNYYLKSHEGYKESICYKKLTYEEFLNIIKDPILRESDEYKFTGIGECGWQYGRVWRKWEKNEGYGDISEIDQIKNVIDSLKNSPESRRHIVTAIDPAHDNDLALYWCHALFQFNCRPLTLRQRVDYINNIYPKSAPYLYMDLGKNTPRDDKYEKGVEDDMNELNAPKYYLDCQLYQRSADVVLGVPFNIASYALLIHIIAKICNMVPGEFIHTFGDIHCYQNHLEVMDEQLKREPYPLPTLKMNLPKFDGDIDKFLMSLEIDMFQVENYQHHPALRAKLSTGLS